MRRPHPDLPHAGPRRECVIERLARVWVAHTTRGNPCRVAASSAQHYESPRRTSWRRRCEQRVAMPTESVGPEPRWLEPLCRIPVAYRSGNLSIRELFTRAAPDLDDPQFVAIVARRLEHDPSLLSTWQDYSYDKR